MALCKIVIADDHGLFREGIRRIIEENPELEVVGEARDGHQLLELLKGSKPDLVILDISMPNIRGIEATREIKMAYPHLKVLILTMHKDKNYVYNSLSAGADGYLVKEDAGTELFHAIKAIRRGGTYITPLLASELTDDLLQTYQGKNPFKADKLTTREREVLQLIAEGKSNRQIAKLLFISVRTVENHRANMMRKLKMKGTADLVRYAIQSGLTSGTP